MGLNGLNGTYFGTKWDSELIRQVGVHFAGVLGALFNVWVGSAHFGLKSTLNGS